MSVDEVIDFIVKESTEPNHQRMYTQIESIFKRLNVDHSLGEKVKERIEDEGLFDIATNQGYRIRSNTLSEKISENGGYIAWLNKSNDQVVCEESVKSPTKKSKISKWHIVTIISLLSALITIYDFLDKKLILHFITNKICPLFILAFFCVAIRTNSVILN